MKRLCPCSVKEVRHNINQKLLNCFLVLLLILSAPITLHAQQALKEKNLSTAPIEKALTPYQNMLKQTGKDYLWLDERGLTLSGLSLYRLLADLGWHEVTDLPIDNYRQRDHLLSAGFLALINLDATNSSVAQPSAQARLIQAINTDTTDQLLLALLPEYEQISQLRKAISQYRGLSVYPWPTLDVHFKPKLGQAHPKVKVIREILARLGYLPAKAQHNARLNVFDAVVVAAIKRFQQRHGLSVDGKLGKHTYAALQVSPKQRIKQLQTNLWRWFILPKQPPERYLLVNIPGYQLSVIEEGQLALQMKVIVGNRDNQTPQMITEIDRLTLNPTWTPTVNIIKNELIPEYQKDYLSLKRKNFQLVKGDRKNVQRREIDQPDLNLPKLLQSYRLVQAPGENNALGYYRFNISNPYAIYLHDTPVRSLFKRAQRALSHGCIRLEKPNLLASYLFASHSAGQDRLDSALHSKKTKHLSLPHPLAVYITYQTAWIDGQGQLRWSPDIYALDSKNESDAQFQTRISNQVITLSAHSL